MPMSNPWHLPAVLHLLSKINPTRVLDVGVGMGTYGFMTRQFLDVGHERLTRSEWKLIIHGIEIFEPYRNPVWEYAYDEVFMGDVRDQLQKLENYDVIICNDVLEHFSLDEAKNLVRSLLEKAPIVIATTPNREWPQGAWGGNEAETHHCLIQASDIPFLVGSLVTGPTTCYISCNLTEKSEVVKDALNTCFQIGRSRSSQFNFRLKRKLCRLLTS